MKVEKITDLRKNTCDRVKKGRENEEWLLNI